MNRKKIAVLFGGCSSEHEVSRVSAYSVISNLSKEKYEIHRIGITKDGRWYLYEGPLDSIPDGKWEQSEQKRPAYLTPDRGAAGFVVCGPDQTEILKVDCVFPVLHGRNGEDGTVQGLLQLSGLPFVGCGTLSSAVCMDKAVTHTLLAGVGIKQAQYLWFYYSRYLKNPDKVRIKIGARLGYPVFVKPAGSGSSVGVSRVNSEEELDAAVRLAATEGEKILVEEAVSGQEVECAVLGNEEPEAAALIGEIAASAAFYDYDDKYKSGKSKLYIPAHLSDEVTQELRAIAVRAYRTLGCRGFARVDFFVRGKTEILLNELNTIPGFTPISMYPKLWEASGLSYGDLLDRLIELALEKA
ncbi:D-alanine--D-alanine ligase family protein [Caproicibacter sp.]|uniref:D-alanine--D-alanine ligase family protein n=1 Tax=Caproicibacter sp. TaxID=2814884 RepID=UPI0039890754